MERDQLQAFNDRLSQWISSQGFWFQMRYSMGSSGIGSTLFSAGVRLLGILAVVGVIGSAYLFKRVGRPGFKKGIAAHLTEHFNAQEVEISAVERSGGKLSLRRVLMTGGKDSFFSSLDAWNVRFNMGLFDGTARQWHPDQILASSLEIDLRSGADDEESAKEQAESFAKESDSFKVSMLISNETSMKWGISENGRGSIQNSHLNAQKVPEGWRLRFQGGTFSQNWIENAQIETLTMVVGGGGIKVEEGQLVLAFGSLPAGKISLEGVTVMGGMQPVVSGALRLQNIPLPAVLGEDGDSRIDGAISGELNLSGSPYTIDGIGLGGEIKLAEGDRIILRDQIPLLPALSTLQSFRRIEFNHGSLFLKTADGVIDIRDVNLETKPDTNDGLRVSLQGRMRIRPPTSSEIQAALGKGALGQIPDAGGVLSKGSSEAEENAARLQQRVAASMGRTRRYEGEFQLGLPGDVFDHSKALQELYPVDESTGRVVLNVPVTGSPEELTVSQADKIRTASRRD